MDNENSSHFDQEIGISAMKQIIIPKSLSDKFDIGVKQNGDLGIFPKGEKDKNKEENKNIVWYEDK